MLGLNIVEGAKCIYQLAHVSQVKTCLETIENDWLALNTDNERAILERQTVYGRYLTIFYAGTSRKCRDDRTKCLANSDEFSHGVPCKTRV